MKIPKSFLFSLVIGSVLCFGATVGAADFPQRNLQGVIMWGAGGATDNVARAITPHVESYLGKKITLINKAGGTGAISTQYVNSRPADGYTLLYGAENPQLHGILQLSELDYRDFYPVNILARGVAVVVANKDTPWNSFKELVDDTKKHPGKYKMGSTGPGGLPYVVGALVKTVTGFDVTAVPFEGEGPGVTAMQGGHVDFMPAGLTAVREHIRAGRIKALAVVSDVPIPGLEDIPLITQDFPEFKRYLPWGPFYGIWCKKDVPDDVKQVLVDAFRKGTTNEQFGKFISDFGAVTMNINGVEAQTFLNKWQSVTTWLLQDAGATKVSPAELHIPRP